MTRDDAIAAITLARRALDNLPIPTATSTPAPIRQMLLTLYAQQDALEYVLGLTPGQAPHEERLRAIREARVQELRRGHDALADWLWGGLAWE